MHNIWFLLSEEDRRRGYELVGRSSPDYIIRPLGGEPYLYRWHVIPRNKIGANIYLHVQVASDPVRPLHDHPWDFQSVILSGGYDEHLPIGRVIRSPGDVIHHRATDQHRLELPPGAAYSMSLFTTGPVRREWGFMTPDGWVRHDKFDPEGRME